MFNGSTENEEISSDVSSGSVFSVRIATGKLESINLLSNNYEFY